MDRDSCSHVQYTPWHASGQQWGWCGGVRDGHTCGTHHGTLSSGSDAGAVE